MESPPSTAHLLLSSRSSSFPKSWWRTPMPAEPPCMVGAVALSCGSPEQPRAAAERLLRGATAHPLAAGAGGQRRTPSRPGSSPPHGMPERPPVDGDGSSVWLGSFLRVAAVHLRPLPALVLSPVLVHSRLLSSPPALMLLTGVAFSSALALAKQVVVDVLHRREPPGPWITRPVVLNARRKPKLTTHMFDLASSICLLQSFRLLFGLFLFGSMQFDCWKLRLHSIFGLVDLGIGVLFSFFLLLFSYPEIDMLSQHPCLKLMRRVL
ncbi:hypothetical protein PVAP13_9KG411301 [Panicum virgatum]|uniref:Uncharacterized protein n=1 Tax=Panicum virgatum TaxID=38727 RepID=A0A8T0NQF8_PANVG|nr:hypothetical protein PVAP13_9KG411301 [Panicum virgatum]